jgi:hypothetical protein
MNIYTEIDRLPPYKISNFITSPRTMSFNDWLNSSVSDYNELWTSQNGAYYTHKDFVYDFYKNIETIIFKNGYSIKDEKQFKNELATFIYRLSRETKQ